MASKLPNEILRLIADKSFTYNEAKNSLDYPKGTFALPRPYTKTAKELGLTTFGPMPVVSVDDNVLEKYRNDNLSELKRRRNSTYEKLFEAIHGRSKSSIPRMGKRKLKKRKSKK